MANAKNSKENMDEIEFYNKFLQPNMINIKNKDILDEI